MNDGSQKKRILSVEDDADSRDLLEFVLSDYEVVFAEGIAGAVQLFEKEDFQLCLLDSWLTDGMGLELCKTIRNINRTVPIVFASGIAQKGEIEKAMDAGAQAYLVKPYLPEELQKVVKELTDFPFMQQSF